MTNEDYGRYSAEGEDDLLSRAQNSSSNIPEDGYTPEEDVDPREDIAGAARAIGSPQNAGPTPGANRQESYQTAEARAYRRVYEEASGELFEKPKTMAYSIVSLVLSILSVVCCCFGFVSAFFGILAIVFSVVSRAHLGYFDAMSIVGLILGIIGMIFGLFIGIVGVVGIFTSDEVFEGIVDGDFNTQF